MTVESLLGTVASAACEETYGIFPCSTSLIGSIFLVFVYGMFLLKGANLISDGSELLLAIMDPGLIGGLLLPILGALPDSAMIVMSGMNGTVEEANKQVAVGIGTLAGSTVMLLSIAWGGSLWVGRCDIVRGHAVDKKLTKELDWIDSGVSTDTATRLNAYIMIASALLYLTPQIPTFMGYPHDPAAAGVGCILCLLALAAYCAFQVLYPELQKRQKDAAHKKMLRQHAVAMAHQVAKATGAMLIDSNGEIREDAMRALFERFDEDGSGKIDRDELRKMMQILSQANRTGAQQADLEADLEFMIKDLDSDGDGLITFDEMKGGLKRWLAELKADHKKAGSAEEGTKAWETPSPNTPLLPNAGGDIEEQEGDDDDDEEEGEEELTPQQIMRKAAMLLLGGTALVGLFSDPMVDAVSSFSEYSGIPAFFVSFVITPFASNASELVSSLQFAKKRRVKNISLTYSQVYGAVTMNNTMCLGLFLFIVWLRGLDWTFSSEVVTTMASIFALGAVAASRQTFQLYWAAVSLALYPVALALVWFLDYEIGWK